ncbi:MAG: ParB/RepB/Spo0J family partition protein [Anaerolineae bacterium]|nr:MAG: ParB/RepB/Spo0J family partition protein [Anaerolineae bacterium]
MARKTGLGKGLDALIPGSGEPSALPASGITLADIDQIVPNPRQPRTVFKPEELAELADSIRSHGVIQPLVVKSAEEGRQLVLIAGERRLQASRQAGLRQVPVIIRDASDQDLLELALIENVQRADLSPLETAEAYRHLAEEFGLNHEDIAGRVGKSRVSVTNTLGLLDMADEVKQALIDDEITEGHARALKGLSEAAQAAALRTVLNLSLNVRQTEELARKLKGQRPQKAKKKGKAVSPEVRALQDRLRDGLGTKVTLHHGDKGSGTIVLHYYSDEELNGLIDRMLGESD